MSVILLMYVRRLKLRGRGMEWLKMMQWVWGGGVWTQSLTSQSVSFLRKCPSCEPVTWLARSFFSPELTEVAKGTNFCQHLRMIPLLPIYRQKFDSTDGRWLSTVINQKLTLYSQERGQARKTNTERRRGCPGGPGALWRVSPVQLLFPGGKATSYICPYPGPLNKCNILWLPIWLWQVTHAPSHSHIRMNIHIFIYIFIHIYISLYLSI